MNTADRLAILLRNRDPQHARALAFARQRVCEGAVPNVAFLDAAASTGESPRRIALSYSIHPPDLLDALVSLVARREPLVPS